MSNFWRVVLYIGGRDASKRSNTLKTMGSRGHRRRWVLDHTNPLNWTESNLFTILIVTSGPPQCVRLESVKQSCCVVVVVVAPCFFSSRSCCSLRFGCWIALCRCRFEILFIVMHVLSDSSQPGSLGRLAMTLFQQDLTRRVQTFKRHVHLTGARHGPGCAYHGDRKEKKTYYITPIQYLCGRYPGMFLHILALKKCWTFEGR